MPTLGLSRCAVQLRDGAAEPVVGRSSCMRSGTIVKMRIVTGVRAHRSEKVLRVSTYVGCFAHSVMRGLGL